MRFNTVVCGGTFDHFHKGHEIFLKHAFAIGKKLIIGITSDSYVKNLKFRIQNSELLEPFEIRKKTVLEFLKKEGVLDRAEIVEINDLFGSTLDKNLEINAIVVSNETKKGAEIINQRRKELNLKPLEIIIAPQTLAEDGKLISSNRIRNGEINREGKPYVKYTWFNRDLKLPENLREEVRKPFGELFENINSAFETVNKSSLIITVGDITTKAFNEKSLGQNLSVVDFKVAREKKFSNILELGFAGEEKVFNVDNPAGYITSSLFKKILEIFKPGIKNKIILQVNGEEDLAVLPLVLLSPLRTIIYYGQQALGVVKVVVSEETKDKAYNFVSQFRPI